MRTLLKALLAILTPIVVFILLVTQIFREPIADPPPPPALAHDPASPPQPPPDCAWRLVSGSYAGYRIIERDPTRTEDNEAVGRTRVLDGDLRLEGGVVTEASVTADVKRLTSDQPRRDRALRVRYLRSRDYPDATFTLDEPFPLTDGVADGHPVTHDATGSLTIRETTRSVTAELQTQWDGDIVTVVGIIPIELADYDVRAPQIFGFRMVQDTADIELLLKFAPVPDHAATRQPHPSGNHHEGPSSTRWRPS